MVLFTNYNCSSRQLPMAMILLIQLSDRFYSLNHSEIMQNKIKLFCKGCDPHVFCC